MLSGIGIALTLGAIGFTNIWNYPPAVFLLVIAALARDCVEEKRLRLATLARASAFIIPVVVLSVGLYLPFYVGLDPAGSFAILEAAPGTTVLDLTVTMPHHLVYIWLPFLWLTASFAAAALTSIKPTARSAALASIPVIVPVTVWAAALIVSRGSDGLLDEVDARSQGWITILVLASLLGAVSLAFISHVRARENPSGAQAAPFALLVAAVALLLMLGMEFFWYHDLWGTRSTTLLKLGYHAWALLSISGAFGAHYLLSAWRPNGLPQRLARSAWLAATAVLLLTAFVFPVTSTFSRTNGFQNPRHLDALILVETFEPDESAASQWLWHEVKGTPVILEAVGDSFTGYGRVSSRTGLPTVLGWPWHEQLWRGSLAPQAGRKEAVARAYMTTDADEARSILDRYDVEYVYVGSLERLQYGEAGLAKFGSFMDVVFRSGQVTIFKTREPDPQASLPSACRLSTRKPAMLH